MKEVARLLRAVTLESAFASFLGGNGFTEKAFISATKSLEVALERSGATEGNMGTVLAMERSEVDF